MCMNKEFDDDDDDDDCNRTAGAAVLVRLFQVSPAAARRRHEQVLRPVYRRRDWTERHHDGAWVLPDACGRSSTPTTHTQTDRQTESIALQYREVDETVGRHSRVEIMLL